MPFVRLLVIYAVVIAAAILFFQRDSVMQVLGLSIDDAVTEEAVPVAQPQPDEPAPVQPQPETTPAAQATQTLQTPTSEPAQAAAADRNAGANRLQTPVADPVPAPTEPGNDTRPTLAQARQAYWNGDLVGAETLYLQVAQDPDASADVLGELGNLYYGQRKYSAAAEYYHRAGLKLIEEGNMAKANALIGILQSIAPQKAADLRARLGK